MRLLLIILLLVTPTPPVLTLLLRDAQGAPIAGATVTVYDRTGSAVLARAATGEDGVATFASLPAGDVRLAVAGTLPGGAPFRMNDAGGVLVILGGGPARLDLLAEADGVVIPDPASISPDIGVADEGSATVAAPHHPSTAGAAQPIGPRSATPAQVPAPVEQPDALPTPGVLLALATLAGCGAALVALGSWRAR